MAYTGAGQLIEAWDYNLLTWGANTQTYTGGINNLAFIWGQGTGFYGYGQDASAMTTVVAGGTVSATQWSTFIQRLNLCLAHQSGAAGQLASGSNIGITSGATIQYFANVATAVGTVKTNANLVVAQGSTRTGQNFLFRWQVAAGASTTGFTWDNAIVFASADQARYFFNAGGQVNLVITATSNNGTARSGDAVTLAQTITAGFTGYKNTTNGGKTGTGGTTNVNNTSVGYRNLTTSAAQFINMSTGTGTYTSDNFIIQHLGIGAQGSNGDLGQYVIFRFYPTTPAASSAFNSALDVTYNTRLDIVYPETTYLGNSWGSPTNAYYCNDIWGIFNRSQATGTNCNLSRDTATAGPLGTSTPLKMDQTGADTYTNTYSAAVYNIAQAASGQTWEITVWMKASTNLQAEGAWIAEADSAGNYLGGGGSPYPNLTTSWQKITTTYTTTNASCAFVQSRLDGSNTSLPGTTIWWDNLIIRRTA
jgi:hypothetical protein